MQAGFTTWTDTGVLQLDSDYSNLQLVKKTRIRCSEGISGSDIVFTGNAYHNTSENIFIAIKNTDNNPCVLLGRYHDGQRWVITVGSAANSIVEVYIFQNIGVAFTPADKVGLIIYDEAGKPIFSSAVPYLNIHSIYDINGTVSTSSAPDIFSINTLPSSNYALAPPMFTFSSYNQANQRIYFYCNASLISNTGFRIVVYPYRITGFVTINEGAVNLRCTTVLVDVSNCESFDWS